MAKIRGIILRLNRRFKEANFKTDQNNIHYEGKKTKFEPYCVFSEEKPRYKFWRGARQIVLFVDGCAKALRFKEATEDLVAFMTQKEARNFVDCEIKQSLEQYKPMKWSQVILLAIPIFVTMFVVIMTALHFGVF